MNGIRLGVEATTPRYYAARIEDTLGAVVLVLYQHYYAALIEAVLCSE